MHRAYRWISISYKLYGFIPPHQSLSRQLPPEGKPFAKPFRCFISRHVGRNLTLDFLFLIAPCNLDYFPIFYSLSLCSHSVKQVSPPRRKPVGRSITRHVGRNLTLAFLFLIAPCNLDCFPIFYSLSLCSHSVKQASPPRRKPVGRFITRQVGRNLTLAFLFLIAPCYLDCFPFFHSLSLCSHSVKQASPLGGSCRVQRLMRGDKSAQQNLTSPHKASAKPPHQRLPPSNQKTSPQNPAANEKRIKNSLPSWRGSVGKFSG